MTAPRVVVEVRGGCVVSVYSDNQLAATLAVEVLDWDDVDASDEPEDEASALALVDGLSEVWP